jgi:hypothetical protein
VADFDPRQLDELEDALESLEHVDDLDSLELGPALTERLAEYQDVLALCREAFPLEPVEDRVLVDVLAEAREVSRRPRLRDVADGERSGWRRFWERWRGSLVPGLALAGTAAVVLWVIEPGKSEPPSELLTQVDHTPNVEQHEPTQPTQPTQTPEPEQATANTDDALGKSEPSEPTAEPSEPTPEPERKLSKKSASTPASAPAPAPEPMNKDEAWQALERADSARRNGDCDRARSIYDDVIAVSPDKLATARAKAGVGLCLEQDRQESAATQWFDDARATNPTIETWINKQRDEMQPHKKSKTSSKHEVDAFDAESL